MHRPEGRPPETHCRFCGSELRVRQIGKRRVGGPFSQMQWQADMVCPRCGRETGGGWSTLTSKHEPQTLLGRAVSRLTPQGRRRAAMVRSAAKMRRDSYVDDKGHVEIARLLDMVPFPVYGLKARPLGLRLRSPGSGGSSEGNAPFVINRVHLGYVAGDPAEPDRALELDQGPGVARHPHVEGPSMEELRAVQGVVDNYGPRELTRGYFQRGDVNKDWNLERLSEAPRQVNTLQVAGRSVEAELRCWDEPLQVVLAHFQIDSQPFLAVTLGMTPAGLRDALSAMVPLKQDGDALAEHQGDYDQNSLLLRRRHAHDRDRPAP